MADMTDPKSTLLYYLRSSRQDLIANLDGLSEREVRLPRTPTGTNLLGIVKHCLNVEAGYFGPTFGRRFPNQAELVSDQEQEADPQADFYATEDETKDGLIDLYRRVAAFADETIAQLPLDAPGEVPWWRPGHQAVTLHLVILHVTADLAQHAGHADILREQLDGAVGWHGHGTGTPDGYDWPAYVTRLTALADRFA